MKLSVVIPAHNEQACIGGTVRALHAQLSAEQIEHEILVVNDNSADLTWKILTSLQTEISTLNVANNGPPHGFGFAVRKDWILLPVTLWPFTWPTLRTVEPGEVLAGDGRRRRLRFRDAIQQAVATG
jgi:cellulose synthase/poly-beta-1,6-N-acetylglucosamine synthase-like glycosyltransferase